MATTPDDTHDADVIIVGCGPIGVALANLLGLAGVRVLAIDRNLGVLPLPRALHVDGEVMRVFQAMDLVRPMLDIMRPGGSMHWVNAQGEMLLVRAGIQGLGPQGWHNNYYYHQPLLEEVLRAGMRRFAHVALREQVEVRDLRQDDDGVTLEAWDAAAQRRIALRARYVVGCDGARSTVRRWVGGEAFEDLGEHQAWVVVDGVLNHPLDLPEYSVQHCDPRRPATSIYVSPLRRRWELMLLPGEDPQAITRPERIWQLLEPWVKPTQATLERAATYVFHSLIAHEWQRGRVLLAGDSAHQTPPFLGQGLCAGIRDVSNLAWKLAHALRQPSCADALLSTYGPERIPHVRAFIELAVDVGRIIQELDPQRASQRDERLKAQGLNFHYPLPRLGPGVHVAGPEAAGKVSIQSTLPDGQWLDDAVGQRFAVILDRHAATAIAPALAAALDDAGAVVIRDGGTRLQAWLAELGVCAVVLRPDRYVFNACATLDGLASSLQFLRQWLQDGAAAGGIQSGE